MSSFRQRGDDLSSGCPHCGAKAGEPCWDDPHPSGFFDSKPNPITKQEFEEEFMQKPTAVGFGDVVTEHGVVSTAQTAAEPTGEHVAETTVARWRRIEAKENRDKAIVAAAEALVAMQGELEPGVYPGAEAWTTEHDVRFAALVAAVKGDA